jgi:hypothetical protein
MSRTYLPVWTRHNAKVYVNGVVIIVKQGNESGASLFTTSQEICSSKYATQLQLLEVMEGAEGTKWKNCKDAIGGPKACLYPILAHPRVDRGRR